jgi:WXG100 family type VII secretion target
MAEASWEVVTEELKKSATKIREKTGDYDTAWNRLYTEVEGLKKSNWTGEASEKFSASLENYKQIFQEMSKILKDCAANMETIADNYYKTEMAIADAANNLPKM